MKKTKHSNRKAFFPFLFFLGFLLALHQPASAQFIPGTIYGKVTIGADPTRVTGDLVLKSTGELYLGGSGNRTHRLELNGNYQGESGSKLYVSITENSNTSGHGYVSVSGTATGSTRLVPDVLLASWDGTAIDLAEATETGSGADAFTMDATTAVTSGKEAVLLSRVESGKRIWYITTPGVELNLKVYLQGPMRANGTMTNYIQEPDLTFDNSQFESAMLPVSAPSCYGISGVSCPDINNPSKVGPVVDWIKVEAVRVDAESFTMTKLEEKVLFLKPDGSIVNLDGVSNPVFDIQSGTVQLVIRHRNHLAVMSNPISDFTGTISLDFGSVVDNPAYKMFGTDPEPQILKGSKFCMYAGDLDGDGVIESMDNLRFYPDFSAERSNAYLDSDLTMDGMVETLDRLLFYPNFRKEINSPVSYLEYE